MVTVHVGRHDERISSNVGSFTANLPELLGAIARDPRCLLLIVEFEDLRYVQFRGEPDGSLIAEVVSNVNIGDALALSAADEERLRAAGWSEPSPGPRPNWRYEACGADGLVRIVSMTRDAVYHVLRERDTNLVSVRLFEGTHMVRTSRSPAPELRVRPMRCQLNQSATSRNE